MSSLRLSIRLYSQRRNPQSPFPYSRTDRKRSLLIGRDLKCVAFAVMTMTAATRACGSHLAHFTDNLKPRHRRTGRLRGDPTWKIPGRDRAVDSAVRAFEIATISPYLLSTRLQIGTRCFPLPADYPSSITRELRNLCT